MDARVLDEKSRMIHRIHACRVVRQIINRIEFALIDSTGVRFFANSLLESVHECISVRFASTIVIGCDAGVTWTAIFLMGDTPIKEFSNYSKRTADTYFTYCNWNFFALDT